MKQLQSLFSMERQKLEGYIKAIKERMKLREIIEGEIKMDKLFEDLKG